MKMNFAVSLLSLTSIVVAQDVLPAVDLGSRHLGRRPTPSSFMPTPSPAEPESPPEPTPRPTVSSKAGKKGK